MRAKLNKVVNLPPKRRGYTTLIMICIIILSIIGLFGCKKNIPSMIAVEITPEYIITETNNSMPVQFAYSELIKNIEIDEIIIDNVTISHEFIEEIGDDGSIMNYKDYYIYGIIFIFDSQVEKFQIENIKLTINSEEYIIPLNVTIRKIIPSVDDDIRPLSIPYVVGQVEEVDWAFLTMGDINITEIELMTQERSVTKTIIDTHDFSQEESIEIGALEKFYLSFHFDMDKELKKFENVYVQIKYQKNEINKIYISDFSVFGNTMQLLANKIDEVYP